MPLLIFLLLTGCAYHCKPFMHVIRLNEHYQTTDINGKRHYFIQDKEYQGCSTLALRSIEVNKEEYDK